MSKDSKKFENIIGEIFEVLREFNSKVEIDKRIPDPDNPSQLRQIDIYISNGEEVTLVECRDHRSKQNVKWVEELLGRKISLNADNVIGVSSNGFTEGALKKANTFGILLKDLNYINKEELKFWGKEVYVNLNYIEFKDLSFTLFFQAENYVAYVTESELTNFFYLENLAFESLNPIVNGLKNNLKLDRRYGINTDIVITKKMRIGSLSLLGVNIKADLSLISVAHKVSGISLFGESDKERGSREALIQEFIPDNWRLIDSPAKGLFSLDLSQINHPENHFLIGSTLCELDQGKKYSLRIYNLDKTKLFEGFRSCRVDFEINKNFPRKI